MSAMLDLLDDREMRLCVKANKLARNEFVRRSFAVVSKLGDGWVWVAAGLLLGLRVDGLAALHYGIVAAVGALLYRYLKNRLVRTRPYLMHPEIALGTAPLDKYSFPSGHTLHAVSLTLLLMHYDPLVAMLLLPFVALVAASRIVLGLHYPSDVAAGAVLGASISLVSISLASIAIVP